MPQRIFRVVFEDLQSQPTLRGATIFCSSGPCTSCLVHAMAQGYALVVLFARGAGFTGWQRAITVCAHRLASEAGWAAAKPAWFPADIDSDARRRPVVVRAGQTERRLEVLGTFVGALARRERAWRVRADTGVEAMLVREPGGSWYADEPLAEPPPLGPRHPRPSRPPK